MGGRMDECWMCQRMTCSSKSHTAWEARARHPEGDRLPSGLHLGLLAPCGSLAASPGRATEGPTHARPAPGTVNPKPRPMSQPAAP